MVKREEFYQGDILKIEKISKPVLVVSKDYFNKEGMIIGCPIFYDGKSGALHIKIKGDDISGYVHCEQMALLDLRIRGYSKLDRIPVGEIMDVTDAIQSIFDYI